MSLLVALRIPDGLARRLDTRCVMQGKSKTRVLLDAIERGWDEPIPSISSYDKYPRRLVPDHHDDGRAVSSAGREVATQARRTNSLNIPGVFLGKHLGTAEQPENPEPVEPEVKMCSYTEYDQETGETYGCRLPAHGAKIKHQRGVRL